MDIISNHEYSDQQRCENCTEYKNNFCNHWNFTVGQEWWCIYYKERETCEKE